VATLIPSAPAGVGAPALSSATRLIPLTEPDEISIRALRPSTNGDGDNHVSDATVATPPPFPAPAPRRRRRPAAPTAPRARPWSRCPPSAPPPRQRRPRGWRCPGSSSALRRVGRVGPSPPRRRVAPAHGPPAGASARCSSCWPASWRRRSSRSCWCS
jgi:hypothetical protein